MRITLVTGNKDKINEASAICSRYGITVNVATADIDEIQNSDPTKICITKVRSVHSILGEPVVVNDSSWSIPALNGFPGGYMKDVTGWFSPDDFLSLMSNHED